ncbi:type II toxin-antitoxin system HipA family toxin [Flavobacterium sp. U410]
MKIEKLSVVIDFGDTVKDVGELVISNKKIFFKYSSEFIASDLQISPFKLPLTDAIVSADNYPFEGLFGVFNDSLPDGWGKLLLDRNLLSKGIDLIQLTPLDRLAYVGTTGMGALLYKPTFEAEKNINQELDIDTIATEANLILEGETTAILEELYLLGGSSGGARPKVMVGYNPKKNHIIYGSHELPSGYEHWIIKFPSSFDRKDIANIEYAYHLMAKDAGIEMSDCKLFQSKSGKYYFGTKRFDRVENKKLHLHSASGLLHDNFRLSNLDYGHLMDATFRLERSVLGYEKILKLAAFNLYAHNRDDHSKNFSFMMDSTGNWQLAPAYDLTFSNSSHGFHSTMIAGESKSPREEHLLELAKNFSMKQPKLLIEQVKDSVSKWNKFAKESNVSYDSQTSINNTISSLLKQ